MKIALVSTVALTTPPRKYGGTELVVAELARGLTALGHDVTMFATGDSKPACRLKSCFPEPVWPPNELAELRHASFAWAEVARALHGFDVVHLHHAAGLSFTRLVSTPTVYTIHHNRVESLLEHYCAFEGVAHVAISERQRELTPELNVARVIHHGLNADLYPAGSGTGGYVAFLGRFAPEKAPHLAVRAARLSGVPIKLGGTYHEVGVDYHRDVLEPELRAFSGAHCCGELGHAAKVELLSGARAMLFPIQWEEPFGLVMIEAMLMGTPVIAFRHGSAPEVIEDGLTGYLVDSPEEMAQCIARIDHIDRARCRERARARWCTERMAKEYEALYATLIEARASVREQGNERRSALREQSRERTTRQPSIAPPASGTIASSQFVAQSVTPPVSQELDHGTAAVAGRG
jgi:glycosyltransferase involved in cell wall biosynthesis